MRVVGIRVGSFVSLDEFGLNGVEEHLPVFLDWAVAEMAMDVACDLLQEHLANPINVHTQPSTDDPWCSRLPAQRMPESKDPDGFFIV
jgi:hypothetical protein